MQSDHEVAEAKVRERLGPRPRVEPLLLGVYGALAAFAVALAFRLLVIPDPDPTMFATWSVTGLAFGACWLVAWYRHRRYNNAVAEEYLKIGSEDGDRT